MNDLWHYIYFRERLLHLLAVRPFKKPELLVRLKRGMLLCFETSPVVGCKTTAFGTLQYNTSHLTLRIKVMVTMTSFFFNAKLGHILLHMHTKYYSSRPWDKKFCTGQDYVYRGWGWGYNKKHYLYGKLSSRNFSLNVFVIQ